MSALSGDCKISCLHSRSGERDYSRLHISPPKKRVIDVYDCLIMETRKLDAPMSSCVKQSGQRKGTAGSWRVNIDERAMTTLNSGATLL